MLGVLYLFYRVRVLTATVTAANFTVHKVAALEPTLLFFLSYFITPALQNVSVSVTPVVLRGTCEFPTFMYITFLLFGLLGIFIVITKFRCGTLSPNSFTLVIESANSQPLSLLWRSPCPVALASTVFRLLNL